MGTQLRAPQGRAIPRFGEPAGVQPHDAHRRRCARSLPRPSRKEPSPLGLLIARARGEGYAKGKSAKGKPVSYHGYYYRILKARGPGAPGGAYDYVVRGKMLGGFALVAYPASWGNSGVMTFLVNHGGVVYQKDLGPNTAALARQMTRFNPNSTRTRL